jgi:hypothetical protein
VPSSATYKTLIVVIMKSPLLLTLVDVGEMSPMKYSALCLNKIRSSDKYSGIEFLKIKIKYFF